MAFFAYREYRGLIDYCKDSYEVRQGGDRFSCVEPGGWFAVMVEVLFAAFLEIALLVVVGAAVVHWWSKRRPIPEVQ
jgi:hypothetical protein